MRNADDVAHKVRRYINHVASGFMPDVPTCAWHDAQAAVPGIAWDSMVRRYRTEGRRQQGKGITRDGMSEGSMRQNLCT